MAALLARLMQLGGFRIALIGIVALILVGGVGAVLHGQWSRSVAADAQSSTVDIEEPKAVTEVVSPPPEPVEEPPAATTTSNSATTKKTTASATPASSSTPAAEPAAPEPSSSEPSSTPSTGESSSPTNDSGGSSGNDSGGSGTPSESGSGSTPTTPAPPTPPVLKNLGVAFAPYDAVTGRAGAFDFLSLQRKPFDLFGANGTEPTFTYYVAEDADVTAVADGYVAKVEYQPTYSDYSILITTEPDNAGYSIDYDHVLAPTVSAGEQVSAGKVLGKAGTHSDLGIGRLEIQVFLGGQSITNYCPFVYFDASLRATYEAKLAQLMADYESFNHISTYYDESADDASGYTGCLTKTLSE